MGDRQGRTVSTTTRRRWRAALLAVAALLLLGAQLVDVDPDAFEGTGLVWTLLWVTTTAGCLLFIVRAATLPEPVGPTGQADVRALRDGTPLSPDDRRREIERIRAGMVDDGTYERWSTAAVGTFLLALNLATVGVGRSPVTDSDYPWLSAAVLVGTVGLAAWSVVRLWHDDGHGTGTSTESALERLRRLEFHPTIDTTRDP